MDKRSMTKDEKLVYNNALKEALEIIDSWGADDGDYSRSFPEVQRFANYCKSKIKEKMKS